MTAAETTDDGRSEAIASSANRAARIAIITSVVCVLYVLSFGPSVGLIALLPGLERNETFVRAYNVFYAPIKYLDEYTPIQGPLERYAEWWAELADRFR